MSYNALATPRAACWALAPRDTWYPGLEVDGRARKGRRNAPERVVPSAPKALSLLALTRAYAGCYRRSRACSLKQR